jgi:hypothetical protein
MNRRLAMTGVACALLCMPTYAAAKSAKLEAAYVVLGAQGPIARAVYTGAKKCPSISVNGTAEPMTVRAEPQGGKQAAFPILVCDFQIEAGTTAAVLDGIKLPLPPATLGSVAVLGDTGCRLKDNKKKSATDVDDDDDDDDSPATAVNSKKAGGKFQDCDKKSKWPFSALAASIAKKKPQLVIHVGDYLYRESPCPKGDKGCKGSPYGDDWDTWKADFFKPTKALLAAAPWIATRGNHEICKRAGDGFMLLLDTEPAQNGQPPACADLLPDFTVTVGGQAFIVFDSSNAADICPKSGCASAPYAAQLAALKPAQASWFVSHRPVWGFKNKGDPINATLQAALAQWNGELPPGITLSVAGHIHIWEVLSFADKRTPQFVLGNGGTLLTHKIKKPLTGRSVGGTTVSYGYSVDKWGYTIFTPASGTGNWTANYYSVKGKDKTSCSVTPTAVSCS